MGLGGGGCRNIGNEDIYAFERTWHILVNVTVDGGMYTGFTGRRQANHMFFQ